LREILSIKASMNKGLTSILTTYFPNITPVDRPFIKPAETLDNN
jgi:hypothetical protein